VFSLTSKAALLARCERMKEAASMAAAAMHACEASGLTLDAYIIGLVQSAVDSARQSIPAAEFDAVWSAGLLALRVSRGAQIRPECGPTFHRPNVDAIGSHI